MAKDFLSDVDFKGSVTLTSTDAGSAAAPELKLYRNSASPADADYLGQIKFQGENDNDQKVVYAKITGKIDDASDTSEDGIIEIAHQKAGSQNISARFTSSALKLINDTGLEVADGLLTLGSTAVTSTAAELNLLDGITAGTVSASLAVIVDSNKDVTGFRNVTLTGELDAATLDISGNADIDGTTNLDAVDIDGAVQIDNTVTVGVDDTGYDVKFFGDSASAYMLWDTSSDDLILGGAGGLIVPEGQFTLGSTAVTSTAAELNLVDGITAGTVSASKAVIVDSNKDVTGFRNVTLTGELDAATLDISGNADIDGTTNLDDVDIDGAVQIDGAVTVGVDDTGVDVKFFGATSGKYMLWDESADSLIVKDTVDAVNFKVNGGQGSDGQVLTSTGSGVAWESAGGSPAGSNTQVQFNNSGSFGADADFCFDGTRLLLKNADDVDLDAVSGSLITGGDGTGQHLAYNGNEITSKSDATTAGILYFNPDGGSVRTGTNTALTDFTIKGPLIVGVDDTGHDVKFFGATSGSYMLWDESADALIVNAGTIQASNGAVGAPSFTFSGDTDTGIYYTTEDNTGGSTVAVVAIATDGTVRATFGDDIADMKSAKITTTDVVDANEFRGDDGSEGDPSFTFTSDGNTGWYRYAADSLACSVGGNNIWYVTSAGNNVWKTHTNDTNYNYMLGASHAILYMGGHSSTSMGGIYTTSSGYFYTRAGNAWRTRQASSEFRPYTDNAMSCGTDAAEWTEVWAYDTSINHSDINAKTDIVDTTLGLDFIKSLKPRQYKWKDGGVRHHQGFIAQEVKTVLDAQSGTNAASQSMWIDTSIKSEPQLLPDHDDPETFIEVPASDYQALRYGELTAPIVKAIQELEARVASLES